MFEYLNCKSCQFDSLFPKLALPVDKILFSVNNEGLKETRGQERARYNDHPPPFSLQMPSNYAIY